MRRGGVVIAVFTMLVLALAAMAALGLALRGGNPDGAALGLMKVLVVPGLSDLGAIMVAPETMDRAWDTTANERAVIALLDAVQTAYRIDARRVVVTGFSMGGAGTWHFAARFPERFSAAVPMAGRPPAARTSTVSIIEGGYLRGFRAP